MWKTYLAQHFANVSQHLTYIHRFTERKSTKTKLKQVYTVLQMQGNGTRKTGTALNNLLTKKIRQHSTKTGTHRSEIRSQHLRPQNVKLLKIFIHTAQKVYKQHNPQPTLFSTPIRSQSFILTTISSLSKTTSKFQTLPRLSRASSYHYLLFRSIIMK
jgi:hypothetical protein